MKIIKISLLCLLILMIACQAMIMYRNRSNSNHDPIITSDGDEIHISCQYTREDLLKGLSAYDKEDGYITEKILIGGFSDFMEQGVSSLEYAVYDTDGNMAVLNRKVVFNDYIPPKVELLAPLVFKASENYYPSLSSYLEGWDMIDGNITKHMMLTSTDIDFSKPGKHTVSVHMKNTLGNEVNMELPIHILESDISGYSIELTEPLIYAKKGEAFKPESYIYLVRNEYTKEIVPKNGYELTINSDVDITTDGIYEIQFSVSSPDKTQRGETWMTVIVGSYGG